MRYAIMLDDCFWNGFIFTPTEDQAATFVSQYLAEKAAKKLFKLDELPEDPEDAQFRMRLSVKPCP